MSHRFPLHEAVFPPLQLPPAAMDKYVKTAQIQLTRALHDYDRYHKWQASRPPSLRYQLHPAMWRPVKTCEQLTVYRRIPMDDAVVTAPAGTRRRARSRTLEAARLAPGEPSVSSAPKESTTDSYPWIPNRGSVPTINQDWSMPTLLQVGTVEGTLDEVLYGTATFSPTDALIKAAYTENEVVDAEILREIQSPTHDEPFRFLGLKWAVKATSPAVKAFVWPRDLTYVEATGILNRQGERVGYHLMHSVDLGKAFGALERKRIVRGRVSSCFFYHQTAPNTVEVYMKTNFEPNGSVHEGVAVMSAANSLTCCLRSALCARNKKLAWMLMHPVNEEAEIGSSRQSTVRVRKRNDCGVCTRPLGTFSRGSSCRICNNRTCSSCCVKKKLSFPGKAHKTIEHRTAVLCTHCLTRARQLDTFQIAQLEVKEREQQTRARACSRAMEVRCRRGRSNSRTPSARTRHTMPEEPRAKQKARQPQRKTEPTSTPSWDYNSEEEDDDDQNSGARAKLVMLLPARTEPLQSPTHKVLDKKITRDVADSPVMMAAPMVTPVPVVSNRPTWDVDSDAEDEDAVYSSPPVVNNESGDEALPEAVVQYAWGEVVPSPKRGKATESWPAPPTSPLQSPTTLPTESEVTWPESQAKKANVWTPPTIPQIPRIHAGASTQEVLAQFAELCNAAENVYHQARKHTVHMEPTAMPSRRQKADRPLDMSALD